MKEGWMKNDEGWMNEEWRMMKDERWRLNDEGWWFQAVEGFWGQTNKQTDGWLDISECKVAFATEKMTNDSTPTHNLQYIVFLFQKTKKNLKMGGKGEKMENFDLLPLTFSYFFLECSEWFIKICNKIFL